MMDSPEARNLVGVPWLFGRNGLVLVFLVGALAATFLASDLAFLACCLVLVGVIAHGWALVTFWRVTFSRRTLASRCFCGDQVILESVLANRRPLPLAWIEIWERLPAALGPEGEREPSFARPDSVWVHRGVSLWPYQRVRWQRRLAARRRGVFTLGEVRLRTGDPFGMFERERAVLDRTSVLVYPRVVPLRFIALPPRHPSLDLVRPRSPVSDPTRTATVRDYRPDDPRRLIHWPTTARRGDLQVRVLEPATALHANLVLDVRGFTFGLYADELLELVLSALASLAVYLQTQGSPVALLANSRVPVSIPPGASVDHLQQILEALARLEPQAGPPLLPWLLAEAPRQGTLILAASEMSSELHGTLAQLQSAGLPMVLLYAATRATRPVAGQPPTVCITPGCSIDDVLEGRA